MKVTKINVRVGGKKTVKVDGVFKSFDLSYGASADLAPNEDTAKAILGLDGYLRNLLVNAPGLKAKEKKILLS